MSTTFSDAPAAQSLVLSLARYSSNESVEAEHRAARWTKLQASPPSSRVVEGKRVFCVWKMPAASQAGA